MRLRKKPWIPQALEDFRGKELLEDNLEQYKGKWSQLVLGGRPVQLEIGCGKGQFLTAMSGLHPEIGYLGIETQREVCYYAVKLREGRSPMPGSSMRTPPISWNGSLPGKWTRST